MADHPSLKNRWISLANQYSPSQKLVATFWQEITSRYQEPSRHYHNLFHVSELLDQLDDYRGMLHDPDAVAFAIWYHDIIYEITSRQNESRSALFCSLRLHQLNIEHRRAAFVCHLIEATKNHEIEEEEAWQRQCDMRYFLDFDIAILGRDRNTYTDYLDRIRREYKCIPGFIFRYSRKKFLKRLLDSDYIFHTEEYRSLYEDRARSNIAWELTEY